MQPSPIQVRQLLFRNIEVSIYESKDNQGESEGGLSAEDFDFDGVYIGESIDIRAFDKKEDHKFYGLKLRVIINNEEGKPAPYNIDIQANGLFEIIADIPAEKREELILVNGSAVLYSAIRELVLNLTSRSLRGGLMLPTANFLDKKVIKEQ